MTRATRAETAATATAASAWATGAAGSRDSKRNRPHTQATPRPTNVPTPAPAHELSPAHRHRRNGNDQTIAPANARSPQTAPLTAVAPSNLTALNPRGRAVAAV